MAEPTRAELERDAIDITPYVTEITMQPPSPRERTRAAITARLIDQHGLTADQAALAMEQADAGTRGEHSGLVTTVALGMFTEQWGQLWQAVQPVFQQLVQAFNAAMEQASQYAEITAPKSDRPAWQSPHGPKQKGHRRG